MQIARYSIIDVGREGEHRQARKLLRRRDRDPSHTQSPAQVELGKATGDAKLEADGKADKVEGKVQKAVGGFKDAVKN